MGRSVLLPQVHTLQDPIAIPNRALGGNLDACYVYSYNNICTNITINARLSWSRNRKWYESIWINEVGLQALYGQYPKTYLASNP